MSGGPTAFSVEIRARSRQPPGRFPPGRFSVSTDGVTTVPRHGACARVEAPPLGWSHGPLGRHRPPPPHRRDVPHHEGNGVAGPIVTRETPRSPESGGPDGHFRVVTSR